MQIFVQLFDWHLSPPRSRSSMRVSTTVVSMALGAQAGTQWQGVEIVGSEHDDKYNGVGAFRPGYISLLSVENETFLWELVDNIPSPTDSSILVPSHLSNKNGLNTPHPDTVLGVGIHGEKPPLWQGRLTRDKTKTSALLKWVVRKAFMKKWYLSKT